MANPAVLTVEQMALSGITDAYGKGVEHSDRVKGCARIVTSMLRTWSGKHPHAFLLQL